MKPVLGQISLAFLLLAPARLHAQSNSQNAADAQAQSLITDMYQQLSIMPGPTAVAQSAQAAFQKDATQLSALQAKGNLLAAQYAPCAQSYQQALPHVLNESKYYMQNNSQAYNSEAAIANPLIKAGAACVTRANSTEIFAHTTESPAPSTPTPQLPGPLYPQYPTPGQPPLQGTVRNNPPLSGRVIGSNACQPFGPGGYNYCDNPAGTQPPGCHCPTSNPIPDAAPPNNEGPFVQGFLAGVAQCAWSACSNPGQIAAIGAAVAASKWQQAVRYAGVVKAVALGTAAMSLASTMQNSQPLNSIDPYTMGFYEGKRFCSWESAWMGVSLPALGGGPKPVAPVNQGPGSVSLPGGLQDLVMPKSAAACPAGKPPFNVSDMLRDTSWLKGINSTGCGKNCSNCVIAVANALAGKGVSPAPPFCSSTTFQLQSYFGQQFSYLPYTGPGAIRNAILAQGNGAQGVLRLVGSKTNHVLNYVVDNGVVKLLDGQLGRQLNAQTIQGWSVKFNWNEFGLLRTK